MSVSLSQGLGGRRLGSESLRSPGHRRRTVFGGLPESGAALSDADVRKGVRSPACPSPAPASPSASPSSQRPSFPRLYARSSPRVMLGAASPQVPRAPSNGAPVRRRSYLPSAHPPLPPSVALGSTSCTSDWAGLWRPNAITPGGEQSFPRLHRAAGPMAFCIFLRNSNT